MKRHPLDKLRMAMQLAFLVGMPLLYIFTDLLKGMHWASYLFVWLVFAANFLFGKLFCSHLCPFGLLSETVFKLKRRWIGEKWEIGRWSLPSNLLRSLKYIFLAALFLPDVPDMSGTLLIAITVTAIIAGGIFDNMFFCKYLCFANATSNIVRFTVFIVLLLAINAITAGTGIRFPFVAVAAIGGYLLEIYFKKAEYNLSMLHVHRDVHKCTGCGKCSRACPFAVDIKSVKRVVDIDCNLCGECVRECRNDALKMGICNTRPGQNWIRGIWFAPLATAILLAMAFCWILYN